MYIPALHVQTVWKAEGGGGNDGKSSTCQVLFTKYLPCCSLTCLAQGSHDPCNGTRTLTLALMQGGGQTGVKCGFEDHEFYIAIYFCLWSSELSLFPRSSSGRYRWGHRVPSPLPRALCASLAPRAHALWWHLVISGSFKQINTRTWGFT